MLTVCDLHVPQTDIAFIAFRVAFFETLERISLADQVGLTGDRCFGYLTEVPFLRAVPPQVQLDYLLETWSRHIDEDRHQATLADESVIYAVCETAARIVSVDPQTARRYLRNGPHEVHHDFDPRLADTLQAFHVNLPNEGDFLLISQFQDMPPEDAIPIKKKFGMSLPACDVMFELLSRWHISPEFAKNSAGLLTSSELARTLVTLRVPQSQPRSLNG
jgi:hypothetical protein